MESVPVFLEEFMNAYFYVFTQHDFRICNAIGKTCGVVFAEDEHEALMQANKACGSENTALQFIEKIDPDQGYCFTVYKASI